MLKPYGKSLHSVCKREQNIISTSLRYYTNTIMHTPEFIWTVDHCWKLFFYGGICMHQGATSCITLNGKPHLVYIFIHQGVTFCIYIYALGSNIWYINIYASASNILYICTTGCFVHITNSQATIKYFNLISTNKPCLNVLQCGNCFRYTCFFYFETR